MPYKICPVCHQTSYSAAMSQIWLCPCCGQDISLSQPLFDSRYLRQVGPSSSDQSKCTVLVTLRK